MPESDLMSVLLYILNAIANHTYLTAYFAIAASISNYHTAVYS